MSRRSSGQSDTPLNDPVELPGNVPKSYDALVRPGEEKETKMSNKVSPATSHDNVAGENGSFAVTSFSISNNTFPRMAYDSFEGTLPQNTGFRVGPATLDSMHVSADNRLDNIDPEEESLHQLARDGDILLMKAVLNRLTPSRARKKINRKDGDKFTPFHYAARYNRLEICELLLEKGADMNALGEDQVTALHLVAKYKSRKVRNQDSADYAESDASSEDDIKTQQDENKKVLDFLIAKGANINRKDFYGLSPLHHAALRGNVDCAKRLLQCDGIAFEAVDEQAMTPLHIAAVYGHDEIAAELINAGANSRCKDDDNGTPLQFAAAEGNLPIVQLLLDCCQKSSKSNVLDMICEKDNDGNTSLHLAVDNGHLHVTTHLVQFCLEYDNKAGLNERRNNKETPLHLAARHGHLNIVKLLVIQGAKINARDDSFSTPLIVASQFDHHMVVEYLLEKGAKLELHDSDNFTALLIAANYGHTQTVAVLLKHKANVMAVDKNDKSVIFQCAEEDRAETLQELLKRKKIRGLLEVPDRYDNTPLHVAAGKGYLAIVKILLDSGSVIDPKNEDEQTPLHLAAESGRMKIVQELIRRKHEVLHDDDENANTPLHLAALSGKTNVVRELVRLGANISARNAKQWTPLDCCASVGMFKSAIILLEADCPVDPKDKRRVTPLHLACQEGHKEMVEVLLSWNADVTHRSVNGRNALDFAVDKGHADCARVIIDSEKWREALKNRTTELVSGEPIDSPVRKLIRKMPEVAAEVFNKCMRGNGKDRDHQHYKISFDYEFLDDEFSCTYWQEFDDGASGIDVNINDMPAAVYDDSGKIIRGSQPYTEDTNTLMNNHPLSIMVKSKREKLLRHPLVVSLLNQKWRSYGLVVYMFNLLLYVCFMGIFNSYMLTVPPPYSIDRNSSNESCLAIVTEAQSTFGPCYSFRQWGQPATYIIYVLAGLSLLKEFYQVLTQRLSYVLSATNLVELVMYILAILAVYNPETNQNSIFYGTREAWQWQCGAVAVFLSWMGLLLFIQNIPRFGIYVLMFTDVLQTFMSFFVVFVLFIFGFGVGFYCLLQNQYAFDTWWNAVIKTSVMMIGEFEFEGIFNEEASVLDDPSSSLHTLIVSAVNYREITYVLFIVFMIIMSIIIMNLLVGLAVDDIKAVQENAELEGLAMQVKLTLDVEYTLPQFIRRRFLRKYRSFSPNRHRKRHPFIRWMYSEANLNRTTIDEALNPEKSKFDEMEEKIEGLQSKVKNLRKSMSGLDDRSRSIEGMTQAIASHLNVVWEKNEDDDESN